MAFQNKFEILASRVMQYGVKREVKVRQQEVEEEVKYFRYWEVGHFKWECPSMEVERQGGERKEWHMWQGHKRHSKRGSQHIPYRKRHRSTAAYGACPQEVQH